MSGLVLSLVLSYKNEQNRVVQRAEIINYAREFITNDILIKKGVSFDCSEYTKTVFRKYDIKIPRSSGKQFQLSAVSKYNPNEADIVFFKTDNRKVGHVGIYLGNNSFIHSPGKGKAVKIDSLSNAYYSARYLGASNIIKN